MKNRSWIWIAGVLLGMLSPMGISAAPEDSLSTIRKVNLYHSLGQTEAMLRQLEQLDSGGDNPARKRFVAEILQGYGDHYREKGELQPAEAFYQKALQVDSSEWRVFNKLNTLYRHEHAVPMNPAYMVKQFPRLVDNFTPAFLLLNRSVHSLFIAACWVFMVLALVLLLRYFPLAQTDLFRDADWHINKVPLIATVVLLLWPLILGPGWGMIPFLILGFIWVYLDRPEKRGILAGMIVFLLVVLVAGFQQVLDRSYRSEAFSVAHKVFNGESIDQSRLDHLDPELVTIRAFNEYQSGNMETALKLLESTGKEYRAKLKYQLLAGIQHRFANKNEWINNLRQALQLDDKDPVSLNNFTLALLETGNENLLESYAQRYPEIAKLRTRYLQLQEPVLDHHILWRRLFGLGNADVSVAAWLKNWAGALVRFPGVWSLLAFFVYLLLVPHLLSGIGKSTSCSKCGKHIDRKAIHRSYKLCNDCYQLFMIKDVMFLEAKILKEKELSRRRRSQKALALGASLIAPGLNLVVRSRYTLFVLLATPVYYLIAFYWSSRYAFMQKFAAVPLFVALVGVVAVLAYILVNLVALKGEEDGF